MAMDYGAKKPVNFVESLLECWSHFKRTLLLVDMITLNMHRYSYEKKKNPENKSVWSSAELQLYAVKSTSCAYKVLCSTSPALEKKIILLQGEAEATYLVY